MLEDVLSYGFQVSDVWDITDVVGRSLDYNITGWEHKLVGTHLRNDKTLRSQQVSQSYFSYNWGCHYKSCRSSAFLSSLLYHPKTLGILVLFNQRLQIACLYIWFSYNRYFSNLNSRLNSAYRSQADRLLSSLCHFRIN